jgi:hypothetical protein
MSAYKLQSYRSRRFLTKFLALHRPWGTQSVEIQCCRRDTFVRASGEFRVCLSSISKLQKCSIELKFRTHWQNMPDPAPAGVRLWIRLNIVERRFRKLTQRGHIPIPLRSPDRINASAVSSQGSALEASVRVSS